MFQRKCIAYLNMCSYYKVKIFFTHFKFCCIRFLHACISEKRLRTNMKYKKVIKIIGILRYNLLLILFCIYASVILIDEFYYNSTYLGMKRFHQGKGGPKFAAGI